MNLLDIIVIILILGLAIAGYRRGLVRKLASLVSLVLSVVLVSACLPGITDFIKNNTPVYAYIVKQCDQAVEEQFAKALGAGSGLGDPLQGVLSGQESQNQEEQGQISQDQILFQEQVRQQLQQLDRIGQTELIEGLPFPAILRDLMLDYNNDEGYRNLNVSTFEDYIVNFIATAILNVISFIAATILVQILLRVVLTALDVLAHIPLIGGLNHLLGLIMGLVQALFLIWVFFLVLSMATGTEPGMYLMSMVEESSLLSYLYNSNLFLQIVLRTAAIF